MGSLPSSLQRLNSKMIQKHDINNLDTGACWLYKNKAERLDLRSLKLSSGDSQRFFSVKLHNLQHVDDIKVLQPVFRHVVYPEGHYFDEWAYTANQKLTSNTTRLGFFD